MGAIFIALLGIILLICNSTGSALNKKASSIDRANRNAVALKFHASPKIDDEIFEMTKDLRYTEDSLVYEEISADLDYIYGEEFNWREVLKTPNYKATYYLRHHTFATELLFARRGLLSSTSGLFLGVRITDNEWFEIYMRFCRLWEKYLQKVDSNIKIIYSFPGSTWIHPISHMNEHHITAYTYEEFKDLWYKWREGQDMKRYK